MAAKDPNSDGLLVILTPQAMTDPTQTAERLKAYAQIPGKPVLASWMGGSEVSAGEAILNRANLPTFRYPDTAAQVFDYMWRYTYNLRALYETPLLSAGSEAVAGRALAEKIIAKARQSGRTLLTEVESKQLLGAYGLPTVETHVATREAEAVKLAEKIGYPAVLKLYSETLTHKTDVGGVQLNLRDAEAVRAAYHAIEAAVRERAGAEHFQGVTVQPMIKLEGYELILGSSIDPQFGPVVLFGTGGQLVEVYKDRALALPPLNTTLARRMMQRTRIYEALKGVRGRPPVDLGAVEELLVRFSQLVVEQRWIREIDINPLLASPERLMTLDARVVLHGAEVDEAQLPKLAIRPYPAQYIQPWKTKKGLSLLIRPIRPEDEPLMVKFHGTLSDRSVYMRYLHPLQLPERVAHDRLSRLCFIDYDREMALVAERQNEETQEPEILGIGRLSKIHGTLEAEYAILISDQFQGHGLGTELLQRLIRVGRDEGLRRIIAYISPENYPMQNISKRLGFRMMHDKDEGLVKVELDL